MKKQILCLLAITGLLTACEDSSSTTPISAECASGVNYSIVGGDTVAANSSLSQSVVFIFHRMGDKGAGCTGTLISNDVILTAAHCVKGVTNPREELKAFFSVNPRCDASMGTLQQVEVQDAIHHGDYDLGRGGDLALIKLKRSAPAGYFPMQVADHFDELTPSTAVTVLGYGQTTVYGQNDPDGEPDLRLRTTQLYSIGSKIKEQAGMTAYHATDDRKELYFDQTDGHGVCHGDSGGPAFLRQNGRDVLIGVAEAVANPFDRVRECGYAGIHTNVVYYHSWIMSTLEQLERE